METARKTEETELEPMESPSTEIVQILNEGDPDVQLAYLEKKAKLAGRFATALNTILISQTYPEDWSEHDDKVCLSSAGAERVARHFSIRFYDVKVKKEDYTDTNGRAYRYIFEGNAAMADRIVYAQGAYGSRDNFLGKKSGEYRPVEDINDNNIRNAAYHIFIGNGIKALLGLRGIPKARFNEIFTRQGEDPNKRTAVSYGKGTQGGTSQDDTKNQQELGKILVDMANNLQMVEVDESGQHFISETSEISDTIEVAKASCKSLTSFYSKKDKKMVDGIDSVKALKGQRLSIALQSVKMLQSKGGANGHGQ